MIIGFSIAAPVGPIGLLCIHRTLANGRAFGLVSSLGAATADALYACVAGFGLTSISGFLVAHQIWLRLVGGTFLCYLGVKAFLARPTEKVTFSNGSNRAEAYTSTFLLTLTNPVTILAFAAVFVSLGLVGLESSYVHAGVFVSGVFTGSWLWWLVLVSVVGTFRSRVGNHLQWVNRISGTIIMGFGVATILSLLR